MLSNCYIVLNKGLQMLNNQTEKSSISNKAHILQSIYNAKRAHKEWVKRADKLVNGYNGYQGKQVDIKVDKSFIPLDSNSCEFGQWFHNEAKILSKVDIVGSLIQSVEEYHEVLHESYSHIYTIFFVSTQQRSFLHKIVTFNSKKVSESEREKAKTYFKSLKKSSSELIAVLGVLEDKIKALDYMHFKISDDVSS